METAASICRLQLGHMVIYARHSASQASYTSIRSIMHHLLSVSSTHPPKCVHKIYTHILPLGLQSGATPFLLPGLASSVIETARTHGDELVSPWIGLAVDKALFSPAQTMKLYPEPAPGDVSEATCDGLGAPPTVWIHRSSTGVPQVVLGTGGALLTLRVTTMMRRD